MALIAIGVMGLILRIVASDSNELVLSGLLPLSQDVVDTVEIGSGDMSTKLVKRTDVWLVDNDPAFLPKLNQFWAAVADIDGAQLVSINPANHSRMGVSDDQGTKLSFKLARAEQASFIIGKWTPDVRLCYVRVSNKDEVYGIPCSNPNIFDPNPDGWRNPVIVRVPPSEIASITFTYPDEEFELKLVDDQWTVSDVGDVLGGEQADLRQVETVLGALQVLVARGFAGDEEAEGLVFTGPDAVSVRIVTKPESNFPTTRVRLLPRDDVSVYAKTPVQDTVYILDLQVVNALLRSKADFQFEN